jgi:dihydrolipoamide dehydrogenase
MEDRDVVIIGGGPAGYRAAIRVSQLGGKATLIENNALGGTCVNQGCIPIRTLLRAAEVMELTKTAKDYGVNFKETEIDISKMISRKNIIVRTLSSGVKQSLSSSRVEIIEGTGKLLSPSQLEVQLQDGSKKEIKARKIILATGSKWKKATLPGGEKIITPTDLMEIKTIPKSMLVIGGGFIGTSIATIFSTLGTKISILEESPRILPEIDKEIVSIFEKEMEDKNIRLYTNAQVKKIEEKIQGEKNIVATIKGENVNLTAQCILMPEEREANIDGVGLDKAGVKLNQKGGIGVNRRMETNVPTILAAGDVTMEHMWTHVAYVEGIIAAENAMGRESKIDYTAIPYATNTFPEISGVGMTEDEAITQGYQVQVGRFPFSSNGLATILGQRIGMIKVITQGKYHQIIGVHMIGPRAPDLIAEAALAMKLEITPEEIATTFHSHPTLSEGFWEAARNICGG